LVEKWQDLGCFWIGSARLSKPLDATAEKKWRALATLGIPMSVLGFSADSKPHRFKQHAVFYLFPSFPIPLIRYFEMFFLVPLLGTWIVFRHNPRILICQSPYEGAIGAVIKLVARLFGKHIVLIVESHGDFERSVFMYRRIFISGIYRALMGGSA